MYNFQKKKTDYYGQYFKANMNNIKNPWKGIKSFITVKISSNIPKSFSVVSANDTNIKLK